MRLDINYKEKNCKKHKHMEIKQHISKQPMDYWRNQKGNKKKCLETNDSETGQLKTYGMQQKQF